MSDRAVGDTIHRHLGGAAKVSAMTGRAFFVYADTGLTFPVAKRRKVEVQLTERDTYLVRLWRINPPPRALHAVWDPVSLVEERETFAEGLVVTVEDMTGLRLSL
jgi:hypothetical protein